MAYTKEQRIQQIKACGQSIIDNAESIFGDYKYSTDLKIIVDLPCREHPTIQAVKSFVPEGFIENIKY